MKKTKYRPIKFPRDSGGHDHSIEWWYFNGHLWDEQGNRYCYMNCFFKNKPRETRIPLLEKLPVKVSYFSHYSLTDVGRQKFNSKINPFCLLDKNSFNKPLFWAHYDHNCLIEETEPFNYRIFNDFVDLKMTSLKKPLLENQRGFIDLGEEATYYYSLTRLETTGAVKIKDRWIPVVGLSWMDHQWANSRFRDNKWLWFSIQLDDGTDIVCFKYGEGRGETRLATLMDRAGRQKTVRKIFFNPLGKSWKSSKTGAEYELAWEISIPSLNIILQTTPLNKDQEMLFGKINYWEGGIEIEGSFGGEKVRGRGFLEILGPSVKKKLIKIYIKEFKKRLKDASGDIKKFLKPYF